MLAKKDYQNQLDTYSNWYLKKIGIKYFWQGKDFPHLRQLLKKLKECNLTFSEYLEIIPEGWYTNNISIALMNSHFNQIMQTQRSESKYPVIYSRKFEATLENQELADYWQHLTRLGYVRVYSTGGGSNWAKVDDYTE